MRPLPQRRQADGYDIEPVKQITPENAALHVLLEVTVGGGHHPYHHLDLALAALEQHPWPGNIRELGNVIERLVLLTDSVMVSSKELLRYLPSDNQDRPGRHAPTPAAAASHASSPPLLVLDYQAVQSHSAAQLQQALRAHGGNQSRAAQAMGLTARQFGYRLQKLGVQLGTQSVDNL